MKCSSPTSQASQTRCVSGYRFTEGTRQVLDWLPVCPALPNTCPTIQSKKKPEWRQQKCARSCIPADVAQLVEQLIRNQQVIGSSPIVGSIRVFPRQNSPRA